MYSYQPFRHFFPSRVESSLTRIMLTASVFEEYDDNSLGSDSRRYMAFALKGILVPEWFLLSLTLEQAPRRPYLPSKNFFLDLWVCVKLLQYYRFCNSIIFVWWLRTLNRTSKQLRRLDAGQHLALRLLLRLSRARSSCLVEFFPAEIWVCDFRCFGRWAFHYRRGRFRARTPISSVGGAPLICTLRRGDCLICNLWPLGNTRPWRSTFLLLWPLKRYPFS